MEDYMQMYTLISPGISTVSVKYANLPPLGFLE